MTSTPAWNMSGRHLHLLRMALVMAVAVPLLWSMPGRADESLDANVRACARLQHDRERLACYDRKVAPLASSEAPTVEPPSEEMFGIDSDTPDEPAETTQSPPAREDLAEITAKVTEIKRVGRSTQVTLDNGQVWQTQEERELLLKSGDVVRIARAVLGTFRMVTPSSRTVRVQRIL
jgi:hypothetical protein